MLLPRFLAALALLSLTTTLAIAAPPATPHADRTTRIRCGTQAGPAVQPDTAPGETGFNQTEHPNRPVPPSTVVPSRSDNLPPTPGRPWTQQDTAQFVQLLDLAEALATQLAQTSDVEVIAATFTKLLATQQLSVAKLVTVGQSMAEAFSQDPNGAMMALQQMAPRLMALQTRLEQLDPAVLTVIQGLVSNA